MPREQVKGTVPLRASTLDGPFRHEGDGNGTARERLIEIQRTRMLAAVADVASERGAANVTVAHVVKRAQVSRRTFYEVFEDIEGCFLEAFDEAVCRTAARVLPAYEAQGSWPERVRAGLVALLEFLDAEPALGRLLLVQAPGAGVEALKRRQELIGRLAAAVEEGRFDSKSGAPASPLAGEGVVGAVFSILHGRMIHDGPRPLVELVNPLMSMIVLPYLGPAAARRELGRPVPQAACRLARKGSENPLKGLDIRLTYRTVRVLSAVAANPGSSNKCVAGASGVSDQGQISKLLARLERLGLVEKTGPKTIRGEPNAWTLTQSGRDVHASVARSSSSPRR